MLWVGTSAGVGRWDGTRFSSLTRADGLSPGTVRAIHEDADLPARSMRHPYQRAGEVRRREAVEGYASTVDALKGLRFRGTETAGVTVNLQSALDSPHRQVRLDHTKCSRDVMAANLPCKSAIWLDEVGPYETEVGVLLPSAQRLELDVDLVGVEASNAPVL